MSEEQKPAAPSVDVERLRILIEQADGEDLTDGGRYFAETLCNFTECYHGDCGEHGNKANGELVELLWNNRRAILAALTSPEAQARPADDAGEVVEPKDLPPQWAGRIPSISKHRASNWAHLTQLVERLDAADDAETADTIIWLAWWRKLDENRHEFLLEDQKASLTAQNARLEARVKALREAAQRAVARWDAGLKVDDVSINALRATLQGDSDDA